MALTRKLKKISRSQTKTFKIKNRQGFAMICKGHLTEGKTKKQALDRMNKALKRIGCILD